jgi:hypothetical protein
VTYQVSLTHIAFDFARSPRAVDKLVWRKFHQQSRFFLHAAIPRDAENWYFLRQSGHAKVPE